MQQAFLELVVDRARYMVNRATSVRRLQHSGLKGAVREAFVRDLLRPLLPIHYVIGQGEIISAYQGTSNQIDVIIADRRILPSILIDQEAGIFPVEASLMTIEVKSSLTAGAIRQADDSARLISKFHHAPPVGQSGFPPGHSIEHVVPGILAFGTDLTESGTTELERYTNLLDGSPPALRFLCVVGRGFWMYADGTWHDGMLPHELGEITGLISGIVNTCGRISGTRFQPDLREYLSWNHLFSDV